MMKTILDIGFPLLLVGIALSVIWLRFGRTLRESKSAAGAGTTTTPPAAGVHAPAAKKHEHHESNLLPNVLAICFVIFTVTYAIRVAREFGQPPSLSTWNQPVPSQSTMPSAVAETVSTRPVPFKAPVGSWYVIEGESDFNVSVCRASDIDCAEKEPIGFRMQCVTMADETVDWSPTACHSFLRLMVQSTSTEPLAATYHYVPKNP